MHESKRKNFCRDETIVNFEPLIALVAELVDAD